MRGYSHSNPLRVSPVASPPALSTHSPRSWKLETFSPVAPRGSRHEPLEAATVGGGG